MSVQFRWPTAAQYAYSAASDVNLEYMKQAGRVGTTHLLQANTNHAVLRTNRHVTFVLLPHVQWPHVNLVYNLVPECTCIANRVTADIFVFI